MAMRVSLERDNQMQYKDHNASYYINGAHIEETEQGLWQIWFSEDKHNDHLIVPAYNYDNTIMSVGIWDYTNNDKCVCLPVSENEAKSLYKLKAKCDILMLTHILSNEGENVMAGLEANFMVISRGYNGRIKSKSYSNERGV
jgi:hypothetical protein